jgi:hypothetical protein
MIGFIDISIITSLNYNQYSAIADLSTFQSTLAHVLALSVSTSRLLATDLSRGAITSNNYKVFFDLILQCYFSLSLEFALRLKCPGANSQLLCPVVSHSLDALVSSNWFPNSIDAARTRVTENTYHVIVTQL